MIFAGIPYGNALKLDVSPVGKPGLSAIGQGWDNHCAVHSYFHVKGKTSLNPNYFPSEPNAELIFALRLEIPLSRLQLAETQLPRSVECSSLSSSWPSITMHGSLGRYFGAGWNTPIFFTLIVWPFPLVVAESQPVRSRERCLIVTIAQSSAQSSSLIKLLCFLFWLSGLESQILVCMFCTHLDACSRTFKGKDHHQTENDHVL